MDMLEGSFGFLGVTIVLFSCLILHAILGSRKLRHSLRHGTIVSLTVGDLLVGVLYCPMVLETDCRLVVAQYLFYCVCFLTTWGLAALHVYHLLEVCDVGPRRLSPLALTAVRVLGCALPWVLTLAVLPFLLVRCPPPPNGLALVPDECLTMLGFGRETFVVYHVCYFVPLALDVVLSVLLLLLYFVLRHQESSLASGAEWASPLEAPHPFYLNVATLVCVGFLLVPFFLDFDQALRLGHSWEESLTYAAPAMSGGLVAAAKSAILPVAWLTDDAVRESVEATLQRCARCCCRCPLLSVRLQDDAQETLGPEETEIEAQETLELKTTKET